MTTKLHIPAYKITDKISTIVYFCVRCVFAFITLLILILVILADKNNTYLSTFIPNWGFLLIGILLIGIIFLFSGRKRRDEPINGRKSLPSYAFYLMCTLLFVLLFCIQCHIIRNIYFTADWDVSYPNNHFFVYIIILIKRFANYFGYDTSVYVLLLIAGVILVNISALSAVFMVRCLIKKRFFAWMALACSIGLLAFSPWILIPYTDTYGVLFTILVLLLYALNKTYTNDPRMRFLWFPIGFLGVIGYFMKQVAAIGFITILIVEGGSVAVNLIRWISPHHPRPFRLRVTLLCLPVGVLLGLIFNDYAMGELQTDLNTDQKMIPAHYIMMDLNHENTGSYSPEGDLFSMNQPDNADGTQAALTRAKERLSSNGIFGTFAQGLWILVLLFQPFQFIKVKNAKNVRIDLSIQIALIASIAYVMLFETGARYLFVCLPVWIVSACLGAYKLYYRNHKAVPIIDYYKINKEAK
jgi:LPXTG-motif cell wall-anchored protein